MTQRQVLGRDDGQRPWRFASTGQDVEDDVVAGDAGQQRLADSCFHRLQAVVEHRCQHSHEPPVGIVTGLVSGGPQLGAGAAIGTGLAAGGMVAAGAATVGAVASGGAALAGGAAAAARGGAALAGGASTAYSLGAAGQSGASGVASGLGGVARAAGSAATSPLRRAAERSTESMRSSFSEGAKSAFEATGGSSTMGTIGGGSDEAAPAAGNSNTPPAWAQRMKRSQQMSHAVSTTVHAVRSGDSHGGGSSINLSESDR